MSKDYFTFSDYINNYTTRNTTLFKNTFKERLNIINGMCSKNIIRQLKISSYREYNVFKTTYFDYFRYKMNRNLF